MHLVMSDKKQFHLQERNHDVFAKYLISKIKILFQRFSSSLKIVFYKCQTYFKSIEGYIIRCETPVSLGENHPWDWGASCLKKKKKKGANKQVVYLYSQLVTLIPQCLLAMRFNARTWCRKDNQESKSPNFLGRLILKIDFLVKYFGLSRECDIKKHKSGLKNQCK